jgi:hypothetical protein
MPNQKTILWKDQGGKNHREIFSEGKKFFKNHPGGVKAWKK